MGTRSESRSESSVTILSVWAALSAAFLLRLGWRVVSGEAEFWKNSYYHFYNMAMGAKAGNGFCLYDGAECGTRPPLYSVFLLVADWVHTGWWPIIVLQALLGALTAACAYGLGRELFSGRVGLTACALTAFYPYYVRHDTSLHPACLFTFLTVLSVYLLLRGGREGSAWGLALAGTTMGLATLTTINLAPVLPLAALWALWIVPGGWRRRIYLLVFFAAPVGMLVAGWGARNYSRVGAPVLTSESGLNLWIAHNPKTFSHYPEGTIDESTAASYEGLSRVELAELEAMGSDEVRRSGWFQRKGSAYIRENPARAVWAGARKLWAAFGWDPSPRKPVWWQNLGYSLSYFPLLVLALLGAWLNRAGWREHVLIYALFLSFAALTAIYWAHTSHRAYLDVYLCVFAAVAIESGWTWAARLRARYTA